MESRRRYKRFGLVVFLVLVVLVGSVGWPMYRYFEHQRLDQALLLAVNKDDMPAVQSLLDRGAYVNARDHNAGMTALMIAATHGHTPIVRLLMGRGADITAKSTQGGDTALIQAAGAGQTETAKVLLDRGADINGRDDIGMTPLISAVWLGRLSTVRLLLSKGADVSIRMVLSNTALGKTALGRAEEWRRYTAHLYLQSPDAHHQKMQQDAEEIITLLKRAGAKE